MAGLIEHSYGQIRETTRARQVLATARPLHFDLPYFSIERVENQISISLGFKIPKPITLLLGLFGLSPGEIKLWHDSESGWLVEARATPDSPPVYHYVDDKTAMAILNEEVTKELEAVLMTPDDYVGE